MLLWLFFAANMKTTVQVSINKPAQEVWQIMQDETKLSQWLTNFVSVEHLSGVKGAAGSKSKMIFKEGGRTMEIIEHILNVKENKEMHFTLSHHTMFSDVKIRLISKDKSTVVMQTVETHPQGFFMKLFFGFMKGAMRKRMQTDFENLKKLTENS